MDFQSRVEKLRSMCDDFHEGGESRLIYAKVKLSELHNFQNFIEKQGIIVSKTQTARVGQYTLSKAEALLFTDGKYILYPSIFILLL